MFWEFDTKFIALVNELEDNLNESGLIDLKNQNDDPACKAYIEDAIEWVRILTNNTLKWTTDLT